MSGTIYLGGGGTHLDESALWRTMLAGRPRVVHWPFALPRGEVRRASAWLRGALDDLGLDTPYETWTRLRDHTPADLDTVDLLLVGGGNTFDLLETVREHGWVVPVRDFVARGGSYYGGSAGAILACDDIRIASRLDDNDARLQDLSALGLVDQVDVLPHFVAGDPDDARGWSRERGRTVLGIPERSGVVLRGATAEVTGPDPVWEITGTGSTRLEPGATWPLGQAAP